MSSVALASNTANNTYDFEDFIDEIAEEYGLSARTVRRRIWVYGWDLKRALTTPLRDFGYKNKVEMAIELPTPKKPRKTRDGCLYPDCFHCGFSDCLCD